MFIDTGMDKENMVHMSSGMLLSHRKNKIMPIIQSEVSQEEKNKYNLLMHIYGIQKGGTDESVHRASNGDTGIENRLTDRGGGEEGEGEMNGGSSMEAYTLTFVNR